MPIDPTSTGSVQQRDIAAAAAAMPGAPAGGGVSQITVSLSSAEIKALFTTPKIIVPAGGAGTLVVPVAITAQLSYVAPAYAVNTSLVFSYRGDSNVVQLSAFLSYTSNQLSITSWFASNYGANAPPAAWSNVDFVVSVGNGNPTTGNGTLKIYTSYYVVTL